MLQVAADYSVIAISVSVPPCNDTCIVEKVCKSKDIVVALPAISFDESSKVNLEIYE